MYLTIIKSLLVAGVIALSSVVQAQEETVLTVAYQGQTHAFNLRELHAMPAQTIATETPWTAGMHTYRGVPLAHVLQAVKATQVQTLKVTALNDYHAVVDYPAIKDYPAILAYEADGVAMRVRDKGPLWLVYPLSDYETLRVPKRHSEMVWQVRTIEIE